MKAAVARRVSERDASIPRGCEHVERAANVSLSDGVVDDVDAAPWSSAHGGPEVWQRRL